MKKPKFFFILLVLIFLVGCSSSDYFTLSGESKHWEGKYSTTIEDGNAETGNYSFHYKNGKNSDTHFKFVEVSINDGKPSRREDFKGTTITSETRCSGCRVTRKDESIKITIKWDDKNEETFFLEQD